MKSSHLFNQFVPHKMLILHHSFNQLVNWWHLLNTPDTKMSMSLESIARPLAMDPNIYTLASGNSNNKWKWKTYLDMFPSLDTQFIWKQLFSHSRYRWALIWFFWWFQISHSPWHLLSLGLFWKFQGYMFLYSAKSRVSHIGGALWVEGS